MIRVQAQPVVSFLHCIGTVGETVFLEAVHWLGLSIGHGSNDNSLRTGETANWMVCYSDRKRLHQRVLPAIINF